MNLQWCIEVERDMIIIKKIALEFNSQPLARTLKMNFIATKYRYGNITGTWPAIRISNNTREFIHSPLFFRTKILNCYFGFYKCAQPHKLMGIYLNNSIQM